ncbi:MAG: NPCBM/NEW2 domain-containing protein [Planctomycetales bacterium]|nr:NPCBM/NEW2 domain-containing protein [Planctomycetales bacterium]
MVSLSLGGTVSGQSSLHTSDGILPEAELRSFPSESHWAFQQAGTETRIESQRIVRWGSWPGIRQEQAVWLSNGSWLCGDIRLPTAETVEVDSDWLQYPTLPLRAVRGLLLMPPRSLARWLDLQSQMESARGERDVLWLTRGRKLSGVIRWPANAANSSPIQALQVDAGGQLVDLPLHEIQAIVFSPALLGALPQNPPGWLIGLVDGSLLQATSLVPSSSRMTLDLGVVGKAVSYDPPQEFARSLVLASRDTAGTSPLSRQPVASYRHLPDSTLSWQLGTDRDCLGRPLCTSTGITPSGLAMHSDSQVAYRWDGSPARLLAEVRLALPPPQADGRLGSVHCQVLLAREGALQTVHEFSLDRRPTAPHGSVEYIDLDITGAKLIVLVTEKSDFAQYGDHCLWLDARVTP